VTTAAIPATLASIHRFGCGDPSGLGCEMTS
jgi:hypothetical protein